MSYTYLLYHAVIRTKRSERTINEEYERELYAYIYGFIKKHGCILFRVNGMPDHVHLLFSLHPSMALSDFMRDLKTSTSKMLRENGRKFPMFDGWGAEYFACSVSQNQAEGVRQYIINQKEHHKHTAFREELILFCRDNGIPFDERYL